MVSRARPLKPLLLLFDIDGTLVQRASVEHAQALCEAAAEVHGLAALDGTVVRAAGRTDLSIARELLLRAGVSPVQIDARSAALQAATVAAYERLCPPDLSARLAPGMADLLAALAARPGEAVRRSSLIGAAWPDGAIVHDNTLDAYLARIRRKLRDASSRVGVTTVRGVGYTLE